MVKYLLFCYRNYYPRGGMEDCRLGTNNFNEIIDFIKQNVIDEYGYIEYDNVQYYDVENNMTYELDVFLYQEEGKIEWEKVEEEGC